MRAAPVRDSLRGRMRNAQVILVALMLVPALMAVTMMMAYARDYHSVIARMADISGVRPVVQQELLTEIMDIVTGRKPYAQGTQQQTLADARGRLDRLIEGDAASRVELEVSRRLLGTLDGYIQSLEAAETVDQQFEINGEINNVALLFLDMLQEAVNAEINAAAEASARLQDTVRVTLFVELGILCASLIFAAVAQRSLSRAIQVPLGRLEAFAGRIAGGELSVRARGVQVQELRALTESLNTMAYKLERLMEENRREQENLKKSELRALQAQITPHFLYNTLDAIIWLAEAGESEQVIEITKAMSNFFRISLNNGKDWVTIGEEWEHLQGYLTIQKIRYRDILTYTLHIDETLLQQQMLKLLIQPLVENALYHGIKNRRGGGHIDVACRREGENLRVTVRDSGTGIAPDALARIRHALDNPEAAEAEGGYGLYSVNKRIRLYYNQPQGLLIDSAQGEWTEVGFCVPIKG